MDTKSVLLALAIATTIILIVQLFLILALAAHIMSRTSDSTPTPGKHDAEVQESGRPPSEPYKPECSMTPEQPLEEAVDDADYLYRYSPPPKANK